MSEAPTGALLGKRFGWLRWALVACAALGAIVAAAWLTTPWYVRTRLLPNLWEQYGLTVTAERQDLSIADGATQMSGVRVLDGEEEILTAKRLEVQVSLRGLYAGRTVVERVVLDDPVLQLRIDAEGRTNVGAILERRTHEGTTALPATLWEEAVAHGGTIEWDDRTRKVKLRIVDLEAEVLDMETGSGERQDRFGQISIDANLEQPSHPPAPLSIVHWTTGSSSAGRTFVAHAALTGIDLDSFPGYIDASQRASLGIDHLDLVASMDARDGVVRRGAVVATSPERTRPLTLRFGGKTDAIVFDHSSQLAALWELPFSRLGRAGDVMWDTGGAVAGGAVGAIDDAAHGDLLGAGESAAGGVGGGISALGSHALSALKSLGRTMGIVAEEKSRNTTQIHAQQRALFLAARREAEQAWSGAHPESDDEAATPDEAPMAAKKP